MGTIKIGCIDVVHAIRDGLSQNSDRCIDISGWTPYQLVAVSPGELHRTVTHAVHRHRRARQGEASGKINLSNHSVPPGTVH
jgi:hypothetical protein